MYRLSTPHRSLQPFIEHYWHVYAYPDRPFALAVDVYVDVRADLIINLGAPYHRRILGAPSVELAHSNLDAQRLRPIRIEQRGVVIVSGARFRTGGLMPFVSRPVREWNNRTIPLVDAFGSAGPALEDALREVGEATVPQAEILDAFFLSRLTLTQPMELTRRLVSAVEAHGGRMRVEALCDLEGTTPRTVARLFRRYVGVGPKTFSRVTRFQRGLNRLKSDPGVTLGELASECGYSDQSHFVREFRRFAGVTPSQQLGYFPANAPTDFSPNLVRFVQDDVMT